MQADSPEQSSNPTATRFSNGVIFSGIAVMVVVIAVLFTGFYWPGWMKDDPPYEFHGGNFTPPNPAASIELTDQDGNPFTLAQQSGKVSIIYFGYTYCPDFCPTTLVDLQKVEDALGEDADKVDVILVTVDPERDTPERLKEYLAFFNPEFIGLTGTVEQIDALKGPWGIIATPQPADSSGQYLVDHSTALYAVDQDGNLRLTWAYGTPVEHITEDIQHILK